MCTVKQLKDWLEQFPDDTKVEVLEEYTGSWYTSTKWVDLDIEQYSDSYCYLDKFGTLLLGDS